MIIIFSNKTRLIITNDETDLFAEYTNKKIAIVSAGFLLRNGTIDRLIQKLPTKEVFVFSDVKPDPSQELVDEATMKIAKFNPDVLLCVGGGSAIDLSKAVIYKMLYANKMERPEFIAIPTTAGTGSEVTNFSIITKGTMKDVIIDDNILPDKAILNSGYTKTAPKKIIADTGIDVVTHAIEAYLSRESNLFTDTYAVKAINLVFENLEKIYEDNLISQSRENMLIASSMAGIAFTNAGLGIIHSMAHVLGGKYHVSHGRLNGLILPYVLKFYAKTDRDTCKRLDKLASELGLRDSASLIDRIEELLNNLDFEDKLKELNVVEECEYNSDLNYMVDVAYEDRCTPTTPTVVTKQVLRNLLSDVYTGRKYY